MPGLRLTAAKPGDTLEPCQDVTYLGVQSSASFHVLVNETEGELHVYWFTEGTDEQWHCSVEPGRRAYVGTYMFHKWRLRRCDGVLLHELAGPSATVVVEPGQICHSTLNLLSSPDVHPLWGAYRERGVACGLPVMAYDVVSTEAVERTVTIVSSMLRYAPCWVTERLISARAVVAVVGRYQEVTDLPPHRFMKHYEDRDIDETTRGLGATSTVPTTSVGEENVTMIGDLQYCCQSLLVHEFGHAIMNLTFDPTLLEELYDLYKAALAPASSPGQHQQAGPMVHVGPCYPSDIYMMANEQEYWAAGVEAWFDATIRVDVNDGVNCREVLKARDPGLAVLMSRVFGDGPWRYTTDCPAPLQMPHSWWGGDD